MRAPQTPSKTPPQRSAAFWWNVLAVIVAIGPVAVFYGIPMILLHVTGGAEGSKVATGLQSFIRESTGRAPAARGR